MTGKKAVIFSAAMVVAGLVSLAAYMFAISPAAIRAPKLDHAHFRLALVANGVPVDFGSEPFQKQSQAYCTDDLSEDPIHFHDNKNQFVHLHWKGISGGLVLKNYGWNMIGGPNNLLGYRFDRMPLGNAVPTYGDVLPTLPNNAKLWVYTGTADAYETRSAQDFLFKDLETFFGRTSTVGAHKTDFWRDLLFTPASAHNGTAHTASEKSQAELSAINNLLGDVVIFAQTDKPHDNLVREAFHTLEPLTESTCGG
jgi:hypothetical protein